MRWSQAAFVARQAARNLRGLPWTHMLTSGTMAMTLFIFGSFMVLDINLQSLLKGWGDRIQINAYLDPGIGGGEAEDLLSRVRAYPEVLTVRYITREQAWRDFRDALGAQSNVLDGLPPDILPSSFEIAVKQAFRSAPLVERLAARLKQEKGVTLVEYPQDWIDRINLLVLAVEWAKWILGGVLFIITFFIVGSTVRLAILARKDEIEIMQLVGSSRTMIQAPFILEGMVQGLLAGAAAILGLWGALELTRRELSLSGGFWGAPGEWQFLDLNGMSVILLLGWFLGSAGSFFSLRRFIRTWRAS